MAVIAGLLSFFLHRFSQSVDEKADEKTVNIRFDAHAQRLTAQGDALKTLFERQDKYHSENTERLDKIYSAIATRNGP